MMNADDISRLGLTVDVPVKVTSETGEMRMILPRAFDVRQGNALMYYPEANVLVPHKVDPLSKTPGFKGVPISVRPEMAVKA
jgi:formylmethanofuran dehydrogenase subunit D